MPAVGSQSPAADVSLSVDIGHPAHAISPRLYGIFFEDINFGGDGGLNAELVKNGSFEFPRPLDGVGGAGSREPPRGYPAGSEYRCSSPDILDDEPAFAANPHYLRITATAATVGVVNEGFRGMGVRAGERYLFSTHARSTGV